MQNQLARAAPFPIALADFPRILASVTHKASYRVGPAGWNTPGFEQVRAIRFEVFVDEQRVPAEIEIDEMDPVAFHVVACDEAGGAVGTGRLFADPREPDLAHIGRMAVRAGARGSGCGAAIMQALLAEARERGFRRAVLSAQTHAIPFYAKFGFRVTGEVYDDVGIPHQDMMLNL